MIYKKISELKEEEKDKLTRLYLSGRTQMFLSKKYNLYYRSVVKILKERNISIRSKKDYCNRLKEIKDKKNEIKEMYLNKLMNVGEIARKFNTSKSTIGRILTKNNVIMDCSQRKILLFKNKKLIPHNKKEFNEEQIKEIIYLYNTKLSSPTEIGKLFMVSCAPIKKVLKNNKINMDNSFRQKLLHSKGKSKPWAKGKTKEEYPQLRSKHKKIFTEEQMRKIINLYENDLLSSHKISRIFNCSSPVILDILKKNNIETSVSYRRKRLFDAEILKPYKRTDEHKEMMKLSMKNRNLGKTFEEIYGIKRAKEIKEKMRLNGLGKNNNFYGKKHSIDVKRKISQSMKGKTYEDRFGKEKAEEIKKKIARPLEKNGRWLGGKSFEPYDKTFDDKFKRAIRKRDNQICMLCRIHREKLNRGLDVHHINYDKKLSIPQNCITLCHKCHIGTNSNRTHWTKFFQSLLSEKYNYQYSPEGEIILNVSGVKNEKT